MQLECRTQNAVYNTYDYVLVLLKIITVLPLKKKPENKKKNPKKQ